MKQILLVFLGGGLGSVSRFLISKYSILHFNSLVLGTFIVNIVGCLLMGYILGLSFRTNLLTQDQALLLTAGFCGGFTTFSAFAAENYNLLKTGDIFQFSVYTLASVAIGILAVAFGFWLSRL